MSEPFFRSFANSEQPSKIRCQTNLPTDIKENLDIEFDGILSVIRTFRNDSGHPSGKILEREQTYVLLQMFIPYCKKIYQLIDFFK